MRLAELLQTVHIEDPHFGSYLRPPTSKLPPLKVDQLSLETLIGDQRKALAIPTEGTASLHIGYKRKNGVVSSVDESEDGELWKICQLQGARGGAGYRIASGLDWARFLAHRIRNYALHSDANVRHLAMPRTHLVTNIDYSRGENFESTYASVRRELGLIFSQEHNLFICDVKR
ncbi:MAG: hypothetical protein AAB551_02580 [Patescibacteria group bacterium]